jgi:hypothetical protein
MIYRVTKKIIQAARGRRRIDITVTIKGGREYKSHSCFSSARLCPM